VSGESGVVEDRKATGWSRRHNTVLCVGATILPVVLYAIFVAHYTTNMPYLDSWSTVALVSSAVDGHLTLGDLWAQHLDNRMFVANLAFVGIGVATRENLQFVVGVSTVVFVGSFLILLRLLRSYLDRTLTPLLVLSMGLVWFSIADWQNAVAPFELAWYMIVLFLVLMLYLLLVARRTMWTVALAVLVAVAASYSSLQGLLLWPVGLVCILWTSPRRPGNWTRSVRQVTAAWAGAAVATIAVYFIGYQSNPPNQGNLFPTKVLGISGSTASANFVVHHPGTVVRFFFVLIGNVIPIGSLWVRDLFGVVIFGAAIYVVVQSWRHRREGAVIGSLPATLIVFGLLFDIFITAGRAAINIDESLLSHYTMGNVLLLVALLSYAWDRMRAQAGRTAMKVVIGAVTAVFVFQVVTSIDNGISQAGASVQILRTGGRLDANLDRVPVQDRLCYGVTALFTYGQPSLSNAYLAKLRHQRLTIFAPGPYSLYRSQGLPILAGCQKK